MQRYVDINEQDLHKLRDGYELLERIDHETLWDMGYCVYGISEDPAVLDAAREAIAANYEEEVDESDVEISEVAVAIPLSSDKLYYLTGSGLKLHREEFAYRGQGGEGIKSENFALSHYKPGVTIHSFSHLALAESSSWLDDFLKRHGSGAKTQIKEEVKRTEEAMQPGVVPPALPGAPPKPMGKQTSLQGKMLFADFLEDFLGR
jgi:hypothetical protein